MEPPASYAVNPENKKFVWKFSIKNSQDFTMKHFETLEEFKSEFREHIKKRNTMHRIKTQVMLAAIGESLEESKFYVFYDNIVYDFDSILEAYECAFQVYAVFNLKYQAQAQHFWEFIQYYFYDMPIERPGTLQKSIMKHADQIKAN